MFQLSKTKKQKFDSDVKCEEKVIKSEIEVKSEEKVIKSKLGTKSEGAVTATQDVRSIVL